MPRPNCLYGDYQGDTLPKKCRYYKGLTFRALNKCPKCILYKPEEAKKEAHV